MCSRAGTTTREDTTIADVDTAACNGNDYNNCDVSTTATSTTGSDTESTTSADTDLQSTPTFTAVDNVDLINPLPDNCIHYISMIGAGKAPPPAPPAAVAGGLPGPGLMLPQARLPQPTVFDGTTPPFQEWIQETRNFLQHQQLRVCTTNGLLPAIRYRGHTTRCHQVYKSRWRTMRSTRHQRSWTRRTQQRTSYPRRRTTSRKRQRYSRERT